MTLRTPGCVAVVACANSFAGINKRTILENIEVAEPLLTRATHIRDIGSYSANLCIMNHKSDYWEVFVPSMMAKKITVKPIAIKELCHIELWNARMYMYALNLVLN